MKLEKFVITRLMLIDFVVPTLYMLSGLGWIKFGTLSEEPASYVWGQPLMG